MKSRIYLIALITALITGYAGIAVGDEQNEYFAVFMDGKKVGFAVQSRIEAEGQVTSSINLKITISRGGIPLTVESSEKNTETADGKPISFASVQKMSFIETKVSGKIDPNGTVDLTFSSAGGEQKRRIPWPKDALLAEGLKLVQKKNGLKSGTNYSVKIFSAGALQAMDANTTIGEKKKMDLLGRVVALTEVRTKVYIPMAGEIESIDYVDDDLKVQKSITPIAGMLIEMIACEKEAAESNVESYEIIDKMFVSSPEPVDDVGQAKSIKYFLSPLKDSNIPEIFKTDRRIKLDSIPSTDNQKVEITQNKGVIVTVRPIEPPKGAGFPYDGNDPEILDMLKQSRFVQSENAQVIKLAKKAVGDTKDAAEAAAKIEAFAAQYIEKKNFSVGYASASEVVESKEGDCSEFSVLTAAMCRAVGIPARIVMGLAYVKEFKGINGSFWGHAWVEAYIGGKWVGLDSSFKKSKLGGYDAGHIALACGSGNPEDFFSIINTLGQFKIDRIVVEKK